MSERDTIHQYLSTLQRYLARLDDAESEDVIREIESHIYDKLEQDPQLSVETILEGFGEPRTLASQYVEHVKHGAPPPKGFRAMQQVKKGVKTGLYYGMGIFGYSVTAMLLFLSLTKLFIPDAVGVWSVADGNSWMVGFFMEPYPAGDELLGYWFVPFALVLGVGIGWLTRQVQKVLAIAWPVTQ